MMAKGANGTIDLASFEQVNKQRIAIQAQNTRNNANPFLGVAFDRLTDVFTQSPLLASVRSDINNTDDRGELFDDSGDIYTAYANVVDPAAPITGGFGFLSTDNIDLNYRTGNPFVELFENTPDDDVDDLRNRTNYTQLTTGFSSAETGDKKSYKGFPDLLPPDIHAPTTGTGVANADFERSPKTDNFGTSVAQDREKLNEVYPETDAAPPVPGVIDNRGTFDYDNFSEGTDGTSDNLGKYFRRTYTT